MMDRRHFVQKSCILCAGTSLLSALLTGCQSVHYVNGTMESNGITVLNSEFIVPKEQSLIYREYIIVRNESLEYPICVYRLSETEYVALLMKCTHQGTELQAFGDHLQCPAHGSEFSNKGLVAQGPAENNLRTFSVTKGEEKLLIELK